LASRDRSHPLPSREQHAPWGKIQQSISNGGDGQRDSNATAQAMDGGRQRDGNVTAAAAARRRRAAWRRHRQCKGGGGSVAAAVVAPASAQLRRAARWQGHSTTIATPSRCGSSVRWGKRQQSTSDGGYGQRNGNTTAQAMDGATATRR